MTPATNSNCSLAALSIAVVGAGRIGVEVIRNLGLGGCGRIDVFERNPIAADPLRDRYTVFDGDFWDQLTLARLQDYDFAVCTVDDQAARKRMNSKCLVANVNLVQAWTEGSLAIVGAYPFAALAEVACYECDAPQAAGRQLLATLKLAVAEFPAAATAAPVTTASVSGALATALVARIASGSHGSIARRATLDVEVGQGSSVDLQRDPHCPSCSSLKRPVAIVQTRNRWRVSSALADSCPEMLDQRLQLSDEIVDMPVESCCVRKLAARFHGGPIPAKFALVEIGGRVICLDFEEFQPDTSYPAAGTASLGLQAD